MTPPTAIEIWKSVPDYEDYYQVSNHGRIKSLSRSISGRWGIMQIAEKILVPKIDNGYCRIQLSKDKVKRTHKIHRLVITAFTDQKIEGLEINHKDFNRKNNNLENLEVVTPYENSVHRCSALRRKLPIGIQIARSGRFAVVVKEKYIGTYDTIQQAETAYYDALLVSPPSRKILSK